MQINIIGLGNVGQTLAKMLVDLKLANIAGIYNRTEEKALAGIKFIGQGKYCKSISALPRADLTFITTADDFIEKASFEYSLNNNLQAGSIVVHCSGVLPASCMHVLQEKGFYICSIHPMHSFVDPHVSLQKYPGTYCAIEGDKVAIDVVSQLFAALGSKIIRVASDSKPLYHAAGVFASNYLLTLSEQALRCLHAAQIVEDDALGLVVSLMQSTINNLSVKKSPESALTGPVKRGDFATIDKHLDALSNINLKDFYTFMLEKTKDLVS